MDINRRTMLQATVGTGFLAAVGLAGCTSSKSSTSSASTSSSAATSSSTTATTASSSDYSLTLDHTAWNWDKTNDVYWQIGKYYVSKPAAKDYETLGIYVPGAYFTATKSSSGTYTAAIKPKGTVDKFTASTAPIVFPVNTPGYAAQKPPTSYSYNDVSSYLKAGFVYVAAGLRGKDSNTSSYTGNSPWGVTDLKAAVRYIRYNAEHIPGDDDRVVVFGMSGGGAQSAIMGASGDSALYTPYLTSLGAALKSANGKTLSDAVAGVMVWCPITNLDYSNPAYEWNMGQFASTGTRASGTWTKAYSTDLSAAFATYLNQLGLKNSSGTKLALSKSVSGSYLAGSYYDQVVSVITQSLNNFLSDTTFPYTPSTTGGSGGPGGGSGGAPSGTKPSAGTTSGGTTSGGTTSSSTSTSTTYNTVAAYIAYLNSDTSWVEYDATTKTAKVTSLAGFVKSQKNASKDVGAFDGIDRGETENLLFGRGTNPLHFQRVSRDLISSHKTRYSSLTGWKTSYAAAQYTSDFAKTDTVGKDVAYRAEMYNPMYYLSRFYRGYKSATVAPYWRIRTGIAQGDTANTTEINLMLALQNIGVTSVDFATVWAQGHTMAERTGNATTNFITWVEETIAK